MSQSSRLMTLGKILRCLAGHSFARHKNLATAASKANNGRGSSTDPNSSPSQNHWNSTTWPGIPRLAISFNFVHSKIHQSSHRWTHHFLFIILHHITAHVFAGLPGSIHLITSGVVSAGIWGDTIVIAGEITIAAARELPTGEIWSIYFTYSVMRLTTQYLQSLFNTFGVSKYLLTYMWLSNVARSCAKLYNQRNRFRRTKLILFMNCCAN